MLVITKLATIWHRNLFVRKGKCGESDRWLIVCMG
eukprot:SAG11_NODE_1416_length_4973_cov_2.727329_1_plen_34_part_10